MLAVGVGVPALSDNIVALLVSALAVGGTFIVITMVGLREARSLASAVPRAAGDPQRGELVALGSGTVAPLEGFVGLRANVSATLPTTTSGSHKKRLRKHSAFDGER